MAQILWGGKGDERKMRWLSWEKMCKPKCMGEMGFEDLAVLSDVLLAVITLLKFTYESCNECEILPSYM